MFSSFFKSAPLAALHRLGTVIATATFGVLLAFSAPASAQDKSTLFERLGGVYNIAQAVDYLVEQIYVNEGLNANPRLKAIHDNFESRKGFKVMLSNWVVQETGGPKIYQQDSFGRGKSLKDAHPHLNISNREFDIIKSLALSTFYRYNIPNEDIDLLMDNLESYRGVIVTRKDEKPFKSRLVK
jgi:hemoglobin